MLLSPSYASNPAFMRGPSREKATLLHNFGLSELYGYHEGSPNVRIGVIDGPFDLSHEAFAHRTATGSSYGACSRAMSEACHHGTFVYGVLFAGRHTPAPALCPSSSSEMMPVFCEADLVDQCPRVGLDELADALHALIDKKTNIINMSLGTASSSISSSSNLQHAFNRAAREGVLLVAASGNHASVGPAGCFNHPWVIPVAACDVSGKLYSRANIGAHIGRGGLVAPGVDIISTGPENTYARLTGTSVAAPFVTGTAALLWSMFPSASAATIRTALLRPAVKRNNIVPPALNGKESFEYLENIH